MKSFCSLFSSTLVIVGASSAFAAQTFTTTFDEFDPGWFFDPNISSAVTNGWYGNGTSGTAGDDPQIDAEIVDLNGNHVLRLSNATTSGNYGQTHAAPPELPLVGESATGATNRRFVFSFDFKSASPVEQPGLSVGPTGWEAGTASRQALLSITDGTNGFSVGIWDVDGGNFRFTTLASGLSRTDWHSIEVDMLFVDGPDNDVVSVTLNGTTFTGFNTWEGFYASAAPPQPPVAGIDTVIFRVAGSPVESVRGGGVYFDNLTMSSIIPEPASLSLLGLAGLALLRRQRN